MKRIGLVALALLLCGAMVFVGCQKKEAGQQAAQSGAQYHIGIVTGTVSQSEDDLRGAEELIKRYGAVAQGGIYSMLPTRITLWIKWKLPSLRLPLWLPIPL
jgi:hypothetical protein